MFSFFLGFSLGMNIKNRTSCKVPFFSFRNCHWQIGVELNIYLHVYHPLLTYYIATISKKSREFMNKFTPQLLIRFC